VQAAFGIQKTAGSPGAPPDVSGGIEGEVPATPPSGEKALSVIQAVFQEVGPTAEVFQDEGGVTVRFEGKVLFVSGSADFRPEAAPILDRLASLLRKYTFDLYILGHTDSIPIETSRFPSNWELSGARAAAALRYLAERGADPQRLVAAGFADSRPVAPNDSPEGRARNRRVEFVFKNPEALPSGEFRPARP
jgi:chemotaxis protein MotB